MIYLKIIKIIKILKFKGNFKDYTQMWYDLVNWIDLWIIIVNIL